MQDTNAELVRKVQQHEAYKDTYAQVMHNKTMDIVRQKTDAMEGLRKELQCKEEELVKTGKRIDLLSGLVEAYR